MEASEQREHSRAAEYVELGQFSMRSDRDGVVHTISLSGELDLASTPAVERELARVEATDRLIGSTWVEGSSDRSVGA